MSHPSGGIEAVKQLLSSRTPGWMTFVMSALRLWMLWGCLGLDTSGTLSNRCLQIGRLTMVPLSNNGDFKGIKLFRIPKKVYIRVLERRLRLVVQPQSHEEKCCFCSGHGCRPLSSQGYLRVSGSTTMCFMDLGRYSRMSLWILQEVFRKYHLCGFCTSRSYWTNVKLVLYFVF